MVTLGLGRSIAPLFLKGQQEQGRHAPPGLSSRSSEARPGLLCLPPRRRPPSSRPRHRAVLAEASTAERLCRGTTVLPEERGPRTREVVRTHGRGTAERGPRRSPAASGRVPEWTHFYVGLYRSGPLTPTNQAWRERLKIFF